ncbi:hypothetical protein L9F63_019622, partial [Diploptera punctata]
LPRILQNSIRPTLSRHSLRIISTFSTPGLYSVASSFHIHRAILRMTCSYIAMLHSFCASTVPKPLMSNGPKLMLEFRGVYSSRYSRGFKATYSFTENFGITTGRQLAEYPCAFVFNSSDAKNGTFASPNFPGFYPRDTECHYFFHGSRTEKVHLHFTYFDVEGISPCEAISASDYVEFSNFMAHDRKYSRKCGQLKEFDIESDRKFFRVTFRSNDRLDGTDGDAVLSLLLFMALLLFTTRG